MDTRIYTLPMHCLYKFPVQVIVCMWVCVSMCGCVCVCLDLERKARLSWAYKAFAPLNMQHFAALCKLFDFPALPNAFHGLFQKKSTL